MIKNQSQGWFWHPRNQIFIGCWFPSKIKKIWFRKPPEPLVGQKNPFPTWNIELAGYYWKCLFTHGKQHLVPWMLKSPLTSVLKHLNILFQHEIDPDGFNCIGTCMGHRISHTLRIMCLMEFSWFPFDVQTCDFGVHLRK